MAATESDVFLVGYKVTGWFVGQFWRTQVGSVVGGWCGGGIVYGEVAHWWCQIWGSKRFTEGNLGGLGAKSGEISDAK